MKIQHQPKCLHGCNNIKCSVWNIEMRKNNCSHRSTRDNVKWMCSTIKNVSPDEVSELYIDRWSGRDNWSNWRKDKGSLTVLLFIHHNFYLIKFNKVWLCLYFLSKLFFTLNLGITNILWLLYQFIYSLLLFRTRFLHTFCRFC